MADKKTILTYAGLKALEEELENLKVVKRKEVAAKIKEAREQGDLSENAEYDAAKDEQRDIEARIDELEKLLKKAEVVVEEQDFDGFLNRLKEYPEIEYLGEVIEHSWGQRVIRFYDLDGHLIEVGEDMKMVVRRFLNTGMTMEEVSERMDVSIGDMEKLLNS